MANVRRTKLKFEKLISELSAESIILPFDQVDKKINVSEIFANALDRKQKEQNLQSGHNIML